MAIPKGLIPARYIGNYPVSLPKGRRFYNVDGTPRTSLMLEYGDELMMPDAEIIGQTILHDPTRQTTPQHLGVGHVVKPEHASLSPEGLAELGYEFHSGRTDFQAIPIDTSPSLNKSGASSSDEDIHTSNTPSVDKSDEVEEVQ